jgi:hypothetical protein
MTDREPVAVRPATRAAASAASNPPPVVAVGCSAGSGAGTDVRGAIGREAARCARRCRDWRLALPERRAICLRELLDRRAV